MIILFQNLFSSPRGCGNVESYSDNPGGIIWRSFRTFPRNFWNWQKNIIPSENVFPQNVSLTSGMQILRVVSKSSAKRPKIFRCQTENDKRNYSSCRSCFLLILLAGRVECSLDNPTNEFQEKNRNFPAKSLQTIRKLLVFPQIFFSPTCAPRHIGCNFDNPADVFGQKRLHWPKCLPSKSKNGSLIVTVF